MREDVIDRLVREDRRYPGDRDWAIVCERAGYKCEYCDKDMLASLDNYLSKVHDHVIPKEANGENHVENYALSCAVCNTLKGRWNPAEDASRDPRTLIPAVRRYLRKKRGHEYESLSKYQKIVGYPSSHQQCSCCE